MKISIRPTGPAQGRWQVQLDGFAVQFRNETEARQFVSTLQTRLNAPHALPRTLLRSA
ncbi:hypothetical protein [Pseudomonas sp.]|uniref:hypothetical protein n=1 Tax=Pseudomonas sp. TaxID=306 RepID=UPI0028A6CA27|nr:hypothetical protein [Pseudomonas sp.]